MSLGNISTSCAKKAKVDLIMKRGLYLFLCLSSCAFLPLAARALTEITFQCPVDTRPPSSIFINAATMKVKLRYNEAPYTISNLPGTGAIQGARVPATLSISYDNGAYVGTASGGLYFFQLPAVPEISQPPSDMVMFEAESFTSGFAPDGALPLDRAYVFFYSDNDNLITNVISEVSPPPAQEIQDCIYSAAIRLWYGSWDQQTGIDVFPGGSASSISFVATNVPVPSVTIQKLADSAVVSWTNSAFQLQAASSIAGTFTNVPGATSPYTNSLANSCFFRLVGQD